MKKYIFMVFLIAIVLQACKNKSSHSHEHMHAGNEIAECSVKVHDHEAMLSSEPADGSIFHLTSEWANQNGDKLQLKDLRGSTSIVSMVYTHCQYACPRIVADIEAIKKSLDEKGTEHVNYVLISIDPERDHPQRLMEFYKENNFDNQWTLLTADVESVMEMAAVLGVKYKAVGTSDFSHSNLITVLNPDGEIVHQQEGLGRSPNETVEFISMKLQ